MFLHENTAHGGVFLFPEASKSCCGHLRPLHNWCEPREVLAVDLPLRVAKQEGDKMSPVSDMGGHKIHLESIERRSLVNRSRVEYGTWGVNHVQGCSHGCLYCYACSEAKAHGRVRSYEEWCKPKVVANAVEQIRRELARKRTPIDRVHLCFATDPFMWDSATGSAYSEIADMTLEIMKSLNNQGIPVTLLTKGIYPKLDLSGLHPDNQYGITAVSLGEEFRATWEPNTPSVSNRIEALRVLSEAGARTWVSIEPYPTPNIDPTAPDVIDLLSKLEFIDKFIFGRLNYTSAVTQYLNKVDASFYARIAADVRAWCAERDKPLHIKHRTPLYDPVTKTILAVDYVKP